MTIGIYNPYLDTLGGGERYCLDIASCFVQEHKVDLFWDDPTILKTAEKRFGINTQHISIVPNIWKNSGIVSKLKESKKYDVLFFASDGSIPTTLAKKTFLIFQFPMSWIKLNSVINRFKIDRITGILCYSQFVKAHLASVFQAKAHVIMPAVDKDLFRPGKKEKLILSVGRFTAGKNTKKQEVLVDVFKTMYKNDIQGWRLVLSGGMLPQDKELVASLTDRAKGFPIEIFPNAPLDELKALYGSARIYWHAAGYGENLTDHPDRAEHFGLTTIEAMSAGAVPIVFAGGGQNEIVQDGINGRLWHTLQELQSYTNFVIEDDHVEKNLARGAQARVNDFSIHRFNENLHQLV